MDLGDPMTCRRIQGLLPLFGGDGSDGDGLSRDTSASVRRHLRGCHACQRQLAGYRAAAAALRGVATAPAVGEEGVGEEFFATLHASTVARAALLPRHRPWPVVRQGLRRIAVAGALVAAGMAVAWLLLGEDGGVGTRLLQQPGLARIATTHPDPALGDPIHGSPIPGAGAFSRTARRSAGPWGTASAAAPSTDVIVPVSFSPAAQGLLGLRRLDLDPRWTDRPRRPESPQPR